MTVNFVVSTSSKEWETLFDCYRYDSETGLYQVRYRYLHPNLGKWLSRDLVPVGDLYYMLSLFQNNIDFDVFIKAWKLDYSSFINFNLICDNHSTDLIDPFGLLSRKWAAVGPWVQRFLNKSIITLNGPTKPGPWVLVSEDIYKTPKGDCAEKVCRYERRSATGSIDTPGIEKASATILCCQSCLPIGSYPTISLGEVHNVTIQWMDWYLEQLNLWHVKPY